MELRPRKGRSIQPPSTPSEANPSPRPRTASRKKSASVPSSPILIPSDAEPINPKQSHNDLVGSSLALQEIHDSSETPLSDFVNSRRKALSSTIKQKKKATSNKKKKVAEARPITQHDTIAMEDACTANDYNNTATIHDQIAAVEDADAAGNITENAREELVTKCKKTKSAKKKSAAKSGRAGRKVEGIAHEVGDVNVDWTDDRDPSFVVDAPVTAVSDGSYHTLSLVLSDDENAQVSVDVQVDMCEKKKLASNSKEGVQAQAPIASSKKKPRPNKERFSEESLNRKLFEETTTVTSSLVYIEPDVLIKHETGKDADLGKEEETRMDNKEIEKSDKRLSSTSETQCSMSCSESLKETDQSNIESLENNEKNIERTDVAVAEEDICNKCPQTSIADELAHRDPCSGNERVEEKGRSLDDALEIKHDKLKEVSMHMEDHCKADDDNESNVSSSSDEDEDEVDLASIFASSMKAHLHISDPSVFTKSTTMQLEQDGQKGGEHLSTKDLIKGSHLHYNISRLGSHGLSWSPKGALLTSKNHRPQQVGPLKARPNKIWEKDHYLQDGLCVRPLDPVKLNKLARKQKKDTTGDKWYNLCAPTITPELKKELQLVKLRGILDPKRHYKAEDYKGLPKYFQVGTVVGGPADFYSGRLTKKEQKNSLANELISDSSLSSYRKRKYLEIQDQKQAGGKGFMKKKKNKRTPAWAKI